MRDLAYLELLAAQYPTERAALGEMLRLEAVQRLPKGTELFLSDVHGEDEAFTHLINNASGIIDEKIMKALPELPERERQIIELRFGLFGCKEHTQKEVADMIGISQSYISRLEKRILSRLRADIETIGGV